MDVRETFERGEELGREARLLPADVYNLTHLMLAKSAKNCLFVPIRSMQYIAVIDEEEIIFVDSMDKRFIQLTWKYFTPQVRDSLNDPVPYTLIYYYPQALQIMQRLQGEYAKALRELQKKMPGSTEGESRIIHLPGQKDE